MPHFRNSLPDSLLNDTENYNKSPAAKHARKDGSLDPRKTYFSNTFNRKLKMRDTFTKIFPLYNHEEYTIIKLNKPVS